MTARPRLTRREWLGITLLAVAGCRATRAPAEKDDSRQSTVDGRRSSVGSGSGSDAGLETVTLVVDGMI
jgi:hypothetical protein